MNIRGITLEIPCHAAHSNGSGFAAGRNRDSEEEAGQMGYGSETGEMSNFGVWQRLSSVFQVGVNLLKSSRHHDR